MEENKRIIEINGIKLEVDLRTAKRIDTFRVGDPVKVLCSEYQDPKIYAGVIVGFAEFQSTPAIEILILKQSYSSIDVEFKTITKDTTKMEIVAWNEYEKLFTSSHVYDLFDKEVEKKKLEIAELERKKKYFADDFAKAFKVPIPEGFVT
jgi:hypothetical protein